MAWRAPDAATATCMGAFISRPPTVAVLAATPRQRRGIETERWHRCGHCEINSAPCGPVWQRRRPIWSGARRPRPVRSGPVRSWHRFDHPAVSSHRPPIRCHGVRRDVSETETSHAPEAGSRCEERNAPDLALGLGTVRAAFTGPRRTRRVCGTERLSSDSNANRFFFPWW